MSVFWLDCSRPINNAKAGMRWTHKCTTEVSRLKAVMERAVVGYVYVQAVSVGRKCVCVCVFVRKRERMHERHREFVSLDSLKSIFKNV